MSTLPSATLLIDSCWYIFNKQNVFIILLHIFTFPRTNAQRKFLFRRFGNVHALFFMFVRNWVFSKIQVEVEGNIHQYSRAWSIITQVIIEIPRRWKFSCCKAEISDGDPESCSHGQQTISVVIAPFFPPDWDVKLRQTFIHQCKFGLFLRPFC